MPPRKKTTRPSPKKTATPPVKLIRPPTAPINLRSTPARNIQSRGPQSAEVEPPIDVPQPQMNIEPQMTNSGVDTPIVSNRSESDLMNDLLRHNEQLSSEITQLRNQL